MFVVDLPLQALRLGQLYDLVFKRSCFLGPSQTQPAQPLSSVWRQRGPKNGVLLGLGLFGGATLGFCLHCFLVTGRLLAPLKFLQAAPTDVLKFVFRHALSP